MAITLNTKDLESYRSAVGQTDTNEVIFKLNPGFNHIVDCVVTSGGTASLKVSTGNQDPTDFSEMSVAQDGTQTTNFTREVSGCSYVGLDVASGTWTLKVRRV